MSGAVNDQTDLSRYEKNDVIKIQAIIRGCLCRARVSKIVQKLIDEILLRMEMISKKKGGQRKQVRNQKWRCTCNQCVRHPYKNNYGYR